MLNSKHNRPTDQNSTEKKKSLNFRSKNSNYRTPCSQHAIKFPVGWETFGNNNVKRSLWHFKMDLALSTLSGLGTQAQDKGTAAGESQKVSGRRPSQGAARRPARSRPPGSSRASRHTRPHKETAHSQNTLPVGAGDVCTVASARPPREHLQTCRPPAPFPPARR